MKEEYARNLHHVWMILEFDQMYEEDYQMRTLRINTIPGLLLVKGQGKDEKSRYRYEITGKSSVFAQKESISWGYEMMETFMKQFIQVLYEVNNYLLDVNCLSLKPSHIYYEDGQFFFCYCPAIKGDIREAFHELTEYFVRETDYDDKEGIFLAYQLHKASLEENYNIENLLEMILERKEREMEKLRVHHKEEAYDIEEERILDDWAGEQEIVGNVVRDRMGVWDFVSKKLHKRNKEKWKEWEDDTEEE